MGEGAEQQRCEWEDDGMDEGRRVTDEMAVWRVWRGSMTRVGVGEEEGGDKIA